MHPTLFTLWEPRGRISDRAGASKRAPSCDGGAALFQGAACGASLGRPRCTRRDCHGERSRCGPPAAENKPAHPLRSDRSGIRGCHRNFEGARPPCSRTPARHFRPHSQISSFENFRKDWDSMAGRARARSPQIHRSARDENFPFERRSIIRKTIQFNSRYLASRTPTMSREDDISALIDLTYEAAGSTALFGRRFW
jgi:hypothetical protein